MLRSPTALNCPTSPPIHKGGNFKQAKNYRPVALTSHLSKIFEKVVRNAIVDFIEKHSLMNPNQHGFRKGHSCLSQLLQHQDTITHLLEQNMNVDVVYLDFSKAFDKLDIRITLQKLYNMGVVGKVFHWIEAFLTNRKQCVVVRDAKSEPVTVMSGVPQGSVIGPLLFLVLLHDIDHEASFSRIASFADDTRILCGIRSTQDVSNLQSDLNAVFEWAMWNNATFNPDKFELIRYGPDEEIKNSTSYLANNKAKIDCCQSVRDLGVYMSPDATFTDHITKTLKSANQKCGWILRVFKTRDKNALITLWKSLVAPKLDYCCQLWSPNKPGQITSIESIQSNFLKKVQGLSGLDYWEQLRSLNMYSLQRRRERYICIYIWKILEGHVPNFGIRHYSNERRGRLCIVPPVQTGAKQRLQTIRHNSMGVYGPRLFNWLPVWIRNMSNCSVDVFKRALDRHLVLIPDEPRVPKLVKYCQKGGNSLLDY